MRIENDKSQRLHIMCVVTCSNMSWLMRIENDKSQRLHIMLLFLTFAVYSFVTGIGCCSLLLFVSQGFFSLPFYDNEQLATFYLF